MAAWVLMSTQRAVSGFAVPSSRPGISRNCRRTSSIISMAASPTALIAIDAEEEGQHAADEDAGHHGGVE